MIALVNQGRAAAGKAALTNASQSIFSLPSSDFHDITSGSNGAYKATAGYDPVTGRGSPIANLVVSGLIAATNPTTTATSSTVTAAGVTVSSHTAGGTGTGGAGTSGSDGGNAIAAAAVSNSNTASTIANVSSNFGENAVGPNSSFSTADVGITKSSLGSDAPAADADQQDSTGGIGGLGEYDILGDLPGGNIDSQFAIDGESSPTAMHSHDAIESLLSAILADEAANAAG